MLNRLFKPTLCLLLALTAVSSLADPLPKPTPPDWSIKKCPPLKIDTRTPVPAEGITVEDISFKGCHETPITAYLVGPKDRKNGKQPAILYVHWYEPAAKDSNRDQFLEEAKRMAKQGVVSLLVSTAWTVPGGSYRKHRWQDDYESTLKQSRDLLRSIELLRSLPEVDKARVAYVGHDFGGAYGAILAGIPGLDAKVKAFVLVTAPPYITEWYLYGSASGIPDGQALVIYENQFEPIEPIKMIAKTKSQVLLQYSEKDEYLAPDRAEKLHQAIPNNSVALRYPADHAMKLPKIADDRREWLEKVLSLPKVP